MAVKPELNVPFAHGMSLWPFVRGHSRPKADDSTSTGSKRDSGRAGESRSLDSAPRTGLRSGYRVSPSVQLRHHILVAKGIPRCARNDGTFGTRSPLGTTNVREAAFTPLKPEPGLNGAPTPLPDSGQEAVAGAGGEFGVAGEFAAEGAVFEGGAANHQRDDYAADGERT